MPVHLEKGLGFVHIPRNGGTYVEHLMGVHKKRPDWGLGSKNLNRSADLEFLIGSDTQHLSYADMLDLLGEKGLSLKWFAIIRNPQERLISVICYMLNRPGALTSKKRLLGSFRTIFKLWLKFYFKNIGSGLLHLRGNRQVNIYSPVIQHLMPQHLYLNLEGSEIKGPLPDVDLYPFQEISRIGDHVQGLDSEIAGGKIPNKSKEKPSPDEFNLKLIRWFTLLFYRKDWKLYHKTLDRWEKTGEPLKVAQ
ncbi:hypothetical protein [Rhodohalobacter sp. 8-1]|uniref:hypothetical protein n=1 Tax=Rhodohalobacter sp. 8-1 TaxID=3131972 RepID=UPI0030EE17F8